MSNTFQSKTVSVLLLTFSLMAALGTACRTTGGGEDRAARYPIHSDVREAWTKRSSYYALLEIIDLCFEPVELVKTTRADVLHCLGEPAVKGWKERDAWVYHSASRRSMEMSIVLYFNTHGYLDSFEWVPVWKVIPPAGGISVEESALKNQETE